MGCGVDYLLRLRLRLFLIALVISAVVAPIGCGCRLLSFGLEF